jgi:hypothetical protein
MIELTVSSRESVSNVRTCVALPRTGDATADDSSRTGPRWTMTKLNLNTVRCEALFASTLQCCEDAHPLRVQAEIVRAVRELGNRGCAARVAQEFGDHPDTAVRRMRWAREMVTSLYGFRGRPRSGSRTTLLPETASAAEPVPVG